MPIPDERLQQRGEEKYLYLIMKQYLIGLTCITLRKLPPNQVVAIKYIFKLPNNVKSKGTFHFHLILVWMFLPTGQKYCEFDKTGMVKNSK